MPEGDGSERIFAQIRRDLESPWKALLDDPAISELQEFRKGGPRNYRLYSFVTDTEAHDISDKEFLVKCEEYGIPQARHRVVLLGVRDDLVGRPAVLSKRKAARVRDVIHGLPALRSGLSKQDDNATSWLEALRLQFPRSCRSEVTDKAVKKTISKVAGRVSVKLTRGFSFLECRLPAVEASLSLRRWLNDVRLDGAAQRSG